RSLTSLRSSAAHNHKSANKKHNQFQLHKVLRHFRLLIRLEFRGKDSGTVISTSATLKQRSTRQVNPTNGSWWDFVFVQQRGCDFFIAPRQIASVTFSPLALL
ncbi:MAG TPA: hypothetical protein VFH31_15915, partial [Pyrinomonadaceae bacterium]|nr:hypothetical protein [Pyrinomonadaceae bacterium]